MCDMTHAEYAYTLQHTKASLWYESVYFFHSSIGFPYKCLAHTYPVVWCMCVRLCVSWCARLCVCALACVRVCSSIRSMSRSHYVRYLAGTVHPILYLGLVPVPAGIYSANRSRPACVSASASCLSMCICCGSSCAAFTRTMRRSYCKHQLTVHLSTS